jgi:hypothetical protein
MEHSKAIDSMAAERYILGELNGEERDAFEEHYFDCTECSISVRDAAKVAATVRLGEPHGAWLAPSRMNWWAAASVLLAGGLGYQTIILPRIVERQRVPQAQESRIMPPPQLIAGDSRGEETSKRVVVAAPGQPVRIDFPFITDAPGPYRGEILDSRGRKAGNSFDVPPPSPDLMGLLVPAGTLHPDNYTLVIRGAGGREVTTYRFEVRSR